MKVHLIKTNEDTTCEAETAKELLQQLNLNATTVLIIRNGKLITTDTKLKETDTITILPVVSGG